MARRGRPPSLIGSGAGASKFVPAKGKRTCKRCGEKVEANERCVEIAVPGSLGHRTYCLSCYGEILEQTRKDLKKLESTLDALD